MAFTAEPPGRSASDAPDRSAGGSTLPEASRNRTRRTVEHLVAAHLLLTAAAATGFVLAFDQRPAAVALHVLLVAEWDLAMLALLASACVLLPNHPAWTRALCRLLPAITLTLQAFLYALDAASNAFWSRHITGQLVVAFAPTVWSGKERIPVGARGIVLVVGATLAAMAWLSGLWGRRLDEALRLRIPGDSYPPGRRRAAALLTLTTVAACAGFAFTLSWGISQFSNTWRSEMITSFFRESAGFPFGPTPRRRAVAERDEALRLLYPRQPTGALRKNVVLIIVDSLRADRMQVYGYPRPTTPFLKSLVDSGRMQQVANAYATCPESLCGITSTLTGREFRDIGARDFQVQDALRAQGYQAWFLLSGNHRAWNGLTQFYGAEGPQLFDGSQTTRYTMDDDRVVLEGLDRVPPASGGPPAFFYIHLMSTHYLGVEFPESHVYTRPDDNPVVGLNAFDMASELNKPDRYDDKVTQADGIIRQVFDALRAKGYLDDVLVVVTGDHGEGLGERHWTHGWYLYDEDLRIPLLLYDSQPATYRNLTFASQVDIAPTILDRLGLPIPASWTGYSLLSPATRTYSVHESYFPPNRQAVLFRTDQALYKFIATPRYGVEELYDLTTDPGERTNIVTREASLAAHLRDVLRAYTSVQ